MRRRLGLLVTDTPPLIMLAAGEALECLTMPGVPVVIPDMVYAEATENLAKLGADDIVQWARKHHGQVEIAPTSVFAEYQALRAANPRTRSGGRGEQAALEVLNAAIAENLELEAVLLFEDTDVRKRHFVRGLPERVAALSTGDLLRELEAAGRIQSADHVLDVAAEKERSAARRATMKRANCGARAAGCAPMQPGPGWRGMRVSCPASFSFPASAGASSEQALGRSQSYLA